MKREDRLKLSPLQQEYHKLAKKADQRLRALEAYSYDKNYHDIKRYAYAKAMQDIKIWSGGSAKRFETAAPEKESDLIAKINDIKRFLESPTSTKRGVTAIYKKRADTINSNYGTNLTWQQLATYYESGLADKMNKEYGSKTALQIIGKVDKMKTKSGKVLNTISNMQNIHMYVDDEVLANVVKKAIVKFGKNLLL